MKTVLLFVLLLPLPAFCQQKTDNLIIVIPSDTTALFDKVVGMLKAQHIKADTSERKSNYVSTDLYSIEGKYNTLTFYNFRIKGGVIFVWGSYNYNHMSYPVTYGDSFKKGWEEMDKLAKLLGTVTYSQQKPLGR